MEDLNLVIMTAGAKGKGSSAKMGLNREMAYSRPGTFQCQIGQACENAGAIVIMVDPKGTSMACHKCGRSDENSRVSQARFRCTNDECDNDINADVNAAHNIAAKAAGRRGSSSKVRETPGRDCSRALPRQNARTKRWRDCKSASKRQKYCVLLYIIPSRTILPFFAYGHPEFDPSSHTILDCLGMARLRGMEGLSHTLGLHDRPVRSFSGWPVAHELSYIV